MILQFPYKFSALRNHVQSKHPELLSQLTAAQSALNEIRNGTPGPPGTIFGLSAASTGLASALSVVESGDRPAPSQSLALYRLSAEAANDSLSKWKKLQSGALTQLNQSLQASGLTSSLISR